MYHITTEDNLNVYGSPIYQEKVGEVEVVEQLVKTQTQTETEKVNSRTQVSYIYGNNCSLFIMYSLIMLFIVKFRLKSVL